jgi:hypothetical protein
MEQPSNRSSRTAEQHGSMLSLSTSVRSVASVTVIEVLAVTALGVPVLAVTVLAITAVVVVVIEVFTCARHD